MYIAKMGHLWDDTLQTESKTSCNRKLERIVKGGNSIVIIRSNENVFGE